LRSRDAGRPRGANLFLRLTANFQDVTGVTVRTNFGNLPPTLPRVLEKALYRVIQEGLTNAFRHGRANEVDVSFWSEEGFINVRLRDDGSAVTPVGPSGEERAGIGLAGLRDRIAELGGVLEAGSVPGGFALQARVPLMEEENER
jgi:signal transduction histidine kinase